MKVRIIQDVINLEMHLIFNPQQLKKKIQHIWYNVKVENYTQIYI